jgi:hypothetical protein
VAQYKIEIISVLEAQSSIPLLTCSVLIFARAVSELSKILSKLLHSLRKNVCMKIAAFPYLLKVGGLTFHLKDPKLKDCDPTPSKKKHQPTHGIKVH